MPEMVRSSVSHLHHSYFNAAQRLVGERPVGQGFGQVDAAHHIRAVESARVRATRKTPVTPVAFLGRAISMVTPAAKPRRSGWRTRARRHHAASSGSGSAW